MFYPGLVSITFRDHTPAKIALAAYKFGLKYIEWGSDIHAPCGDIQHLQFIAGLHDTFDISCCSYGTYFRLGHSPITDLPQYIEAAKILGTNVLRLWAGRKKATDCSKEERDHLFAECRKAAKLAEANDVIICLECHRRSYTETMEGALELMKEIDSPNFRMYWQPNPDISLEDNLDYIRTLDPYITHIHVFNWTADQRHPLYTGIDTWKNYLSELSGDHHLLLEFMPDDRIQSLESEADALKEIIK